MTTGGGGPPWYSFLYRALGAHGTFWLWIVTLSVLWWTAPGSLVRLREREAEVRSVSDVARHRSVPRWVELAGIRLELEATLLRRDPEVRLPEATILLDPTDPAARFFSESLAFAEASAAAETSRTLAVAVALGGAAGALPARTQAEAREALLDRYTALATQDPARAIRVRPGGAILLTEALEPERGSKALERPARPATPDELSDFDRQLSLWSESLRAHVSRVTVQGLLESASPSLVGRIEKKAGIGVADRTLRVGRKPSDKELYAFCVAAFCFVFLATGLHGVVSAGRRHRVARGA